MGTNISVRKVSLSRTLEKKNWLKNYRETKYYVKQLCSWNLIMKQTTFLVIRANVSRKQHRS